MMTWISTVASVGMAVVPPFVYADQIYSIIRKKDSTGFSRDVCAILLIANITRCFFWIGKHFEIALLVQSILMIIAQLVLLYICIRYRPPGNPESIGKSSRVIGFWQWPTYSQYVEFLSAYIIVMTILILIFGRIAFFVDVIGYFALGLESTLPLPQLLSNYRQRSLYGFRASTLIGWVAGDSFKTGYFILQKAPLQFIVNSLYHPILRLAYGTAQPSIPPDEEDILEQALRLEEEDQGIPRRGIVEQGL
ncbi:hypothetical protein BS47DRAFT_1371132 [Hydnum rufescens UP504]|uniref:PQ-loop repeat-containing protein 1 n=1 Tax=Hydnum rufescens UP504 TaxID=1448309 RepID=A0A9P6B6K2_9AGAM|nr:hypothetical protein BS47DRAFT_1371132 [Hydnum rufescens UP504]